MSLVFVVVSDLFLLLFRLSLQAQPKPDAGSSTGAPFVKSGPLGLNLGATVRYRIMPNFGVYAAPELDIQLPAVLMNLDLTLAGVEAAF